MLYISLCEENEIGAPQFMSESPSQVSGEKKENITCIYREESWHLLVLISSRSRSPALTTHWGWSRTRSDSAGPSINWRRSNKKLIPPSKNQKWMGRATWSVITSDTHTGRWLLHNSSLVFIYVERRRSSKSGKELRDALIIGRKAVGVELRSKSFSIKILMK